MALPHGTDDPIVPYDGGCAAAGFDANPVVEDVISLAAQAGCNPQPIVELEDDVVKAVAVGRMHAGHRRRAALNPRRWPFLPGNSRLSTNPKSLLSGR